MSRYKILLLCFSIAGFLGCDAQIRHVRGITSADVYYLHSRFGEGFGASYIKYFSNALYGKVSGFVEQGKDAGLSYRSVGADVAVAKTILHGGHRDYLNAIGGCMISIDGIFKGGEQFHIQNEFKAGALVGMENELFITDRFVFIVSWSQRFLIRPPFGNYRWFASAGIRFNF